MRKRVMYFMPDNPMDGKAGNLTKCMQMLDYFESNSNVLDVDFVSFSAHTWNYEAISLFKNKFPSIRLFLIERRPKVSNLFRYLVNYKIPKLLNIINIHKKYIDLSNGYIKLQIRKILSEFKYDSVIISYASYGNLVKKNKDTKLILDTHDFMTSQYIQKKKNGSLLPLGNVFAEEIKIINQFDEIWTYSIEEKYIFEQFTEKDIKLMPVSFPLNSKSSNQELNVDILYIASDNPHNVKSINWYLNDVIPLLGNVNSFVVGKICEHIGDYKGVVKLGVVEDIDSLYKRAKICICPMLSGTGVKIKVLEALSYGIPTVTTARGVDGLINKLNNGCLVSSCALEFAINILTLLNDKDFYRKISNEAYLYAANNHAPHQEKEFLDSVLLS